MNVPASLEDVPVVGHVYRVGENPTTSTLVLLGPAIVLLIALVGRTPMTVALAALYVLSVPAYVLIEWRRGGEVEEASDEEGEDG